MEGKEGFRFRNINDFITRLSTGCQAGGGGGTGGSTNPASTTSASASATLGGSSRTYDLYDAEADVNREKRTQRHLGAMASSQVLCVCPLMILR
ncbi:AGAP000383-PA-like protein [Anopheles sinensis]|uniref:AGAP000383-PA-like protein n=1 Tax=Anopheles sinensis TaxID=74873 RepID=A0A084VV85_ANOSI|nr:AGAP000383-PA-like protein [Anopheles sinensis]